MSVRSLKEGLERLKRLVMSSGVGGDTPEEKLKNLGVCLDLSFPTEKYLITPEYHGPNPQVLNHNLHMARADLSHRGPKAWEKLFLRGPWDKGSSPPSTEEEMREYLKELESFSEALRETFSADYESWETLGEEDPLEEYLPSYSPHFRVFVAWYLQASEEEIEAWRRKVVERGFPSGEDFLRREDLVWEVVQGIRERED